MKKLDFLKILNRKGKIILVEPSEEINSSYLIKSNNCLKSSKLLFQNQLYENSFSEAYYCMYNALLSLLFKVGIKSEDHSASILLLNNLFGESELYKTISSAKKERIDKQYYTASQQFNVANEKSCKEIIEQSENFLIGIKLILDRLNNERIQDMRVLFKDQIKEK